MNRDNFDRNNFSCVGMARKLKAEIGAKLNNMTDAERAEYFERINAKHRKCHIPQAQLA